MKEWSVGHPGVEVNGEGDARGRGEDAGVRTKSVGSDEGGDSEVDVLGVSSRQDVSFTRFPWEGSRELRLCGLR